MHELSVCQALLTQVAEIADARGARLVERITIEVGPLSGTEPTLLLNAFIAMRSGITSTAELRIEHCTVGITCLECGAYSQTQPNRLICAPCGSWRTRVIAGDGLRLLRVEMRTPDSSDMQPSPNPIEKPPLCVRPAAARFVPMTRTVISCIRTRQFTVVDVVQELLAANDITAAHNRQHFDDHEVLAINLMSSPGSGKTALLEATIHALKSHYRIAVIEGDLQTENDAQRIRACGVPALQITTGTACHLDASLVHRALHSLPLAEVDLLFIENVGNLVCPASFDLGQHLNVTLLSVTEGDDKPAKYPVIFRASDLVVLSKTDLLAVLDDFNPSRAVSAVRALGLDIPIISTAARGVPAMAAWLDWLEAQLQQRGVGRTLSRNETSVDRAALTPCA